MSTPSLYTAKECFSTVENITRSGGSLPLWSDERTRLNVNSLPVPSLWLDVFQKIKALGYNGVSFYVDWALLEGKPGDFSAEGIFAWEPFFDAAKEAGIYLLAVSKSYRDPDVSDTDFSVLASWSVHQCRSVWRRIPWLAATTPSLAQDS